MYSVGIITVSDKGYAGEREDLSGPAIKECLEADRYEVRFMELVPDEQGMIRDKLLELCDKGADLILTTGGTGFSKRDVTPEATMEVCDRNVPGIPEAMRALSMKYTDRAMLSRAVCVIHGETLIINLPGSPKAVKECMGFIMGAVGHGLDILTGRDGECAGGAK
jgi:molybdenum cofactor synthesis domain-containing protein